MEVVANGVHCGLLEGLITHSLLRHCFDKLRVYCLYAIGGLQLVFIWSDDMFDAACLCLKSWLQRSLANVSDTI